MPTPNIDSLRILIDYTDWSNDRLLEAAAPVDDGGLDRDMQIGPGTLRRTLLHIYNGELVWLRRCQGRGGGPLGETPWPSEAERVSVVELRARFASMRVERNAFIESLAASGANLDAMHRYRDSFGKLFSASLGDMLIQAVMHSKHHQAQAVNILRRLDAKWPELDYMYRVRTSA